jgi:integrase
VDRGREDGRRPGDAALAAAYPRFDADRPGLDVLTISRRLGHGSPAITLGVYGHLFKPDDRAAAIMEAALKKPK